MLEVLNAIYKHLSRLNRPVVRLLDDGLSADQVRTRLDELPFAPTEELAALYQWRNGTRYDENATYDDIYFFPGYYLLSLDDAIEHYRSLVEAGVWDRKWIPVFASGGGDFYAVFDASCKNPGVIDFLRGEPDTPIEFTSLTRMMRTLLECLENGALYNGEEGTFEIDYDAYHTVAYKHAPDVGVYGEEE